MELLKIFDENRREIGVASREDVHKLGYWHETFQCWFFRGEEIYLQLRSPLKKDYPGLLDITAAGHLLATESVRDGVREIEEELGMKIAFEDLIPVGVVEDAAIQEDFIDKELAHVFLYPFNQDFDAFTLQTEEVAGVVKANLTDFQNLWLGKINAIRTQGFQLEADGTKTFIDRLVGREQFVQHPHSYFSKVIGKIIENK